MTGIAGRVKVVVGDEPVLVEAVAPARVSPLTVTVTFESLIGFWLRVRAVEGWNGKGICDRCAGIKHQRKTGSVDR